MMADARTHGRADARGLRGAAWRRWLGVAGVLAVPLCVCASVPAVLQAQLVGHEPDQSPYRDIVTHESFTLFLGRWAGNTGAAGVGTLPSAAFGGRLAIRLSGPVDFWATFGEAMTSRHVIIADTSITHTDSAKRGPDARLPTVLADLALVLNMTGDKTWHRLAPYVGMGIGFVAPTRKLADPGGFQIGLNFAIVPTLGTRLFLSDALALRFEVRDYYFRYQYPLAYFDTLNLKYAGPPPRKSVLPLGTTNAEWTSNLTLWIGVAYGFTF